MSNFAAGNPNTQPFRDFAAWTGIALGCLSVVVTLAAWLYLHETS